MLKHFVGSALAGASTAVALLLRSVFRAPLSEELANPTWVSTCPPLWKWVVALLLGATIGGLVGWWLGRRCQSSVLRPLVLPGFAALVFVPFVARAVPFLSAWSGTFLDLVLIACAGAVLWNVAGSIGESKWLTPNRVAIAVFGVFLAVGFHLQDRVGLSGDEPHYVLIIHSLLEDGDLAVADDYDEEAYRAFYSGTIGPHLAYGSPYSVHGVGLPLLLLPGFALLGLPGILLTEALLGSILAREVFRMTEILTESRAAALLAAAGLGCTAPGLFLCVSAYPELPAAVIVAAGCRRLVDATPIRASHGIGWGLLFGLLPFLHVKFVPLAGVMAIGLMVSKREARGWIAWGALAGGVALMAFSLVLFGSPNPLSSYGRQRVFLERIPLGLAGLLFDQEFGLLLASPFYLAALVGVAALARRRPHLVWMSFGILASVALPGAAHPLWSGGTSPPARFLFPGLPWLSMAAATSWRDQVDRGISGWTRPLLVISLAIAGYMAVAPELPLHLNQRDGTGNVWVSLGQSWDLTHYLPSLVRADSRSLAMAGLGGTSLLLGWLFDRVSRRRRLPPFTAVVFLGTILVDGISPGAAPSDHRTSAMIRLLQGLPSRSQDRFVLLPSAEPIAHREVVARVEVPLETARAARFDPGEFESLPFQLPAGEFLLDGDSVEASRLCNAEGCLAPAHVGERFRSLLALSAFHLRSGRRDSLWRLRALRLDFPSVVALHSLALPSGVRLHALDEESYTEPNGLWVRGGATARVAFEAERRELVVVSLTNGSQENWIELESRQGRQRFRLRPKEAKRVEVRMAGGLALAEVTSSSGFRPSEDDRPSGDRRFLGVLVTVPEL